MGEKNKNVISSAVFCVDTENLARNNSALNIQECVSVFNMNRNVRENILDLHSLKWLPARNSKQLQNSLMKTGTVLNRNGYQISLQIQDGGEHNEQTLQ